MLTTKHAVASCPTCGTRLDASTNAEGKHVEPKPGDISICGKCATVMTYEQTPDGVRVRAATPEELESFDAEDAARIARVQDLIFAMRLLE